MSYTNVPCNKRTNSFGSSHAWRTCNRCGYRSCSVVCSCPSGVQMGFEQMKSANVNPLVELMIMVLVELMMVVIIFSMIGAVLFGD